MTKKFPDLKKIIYTEHVSYDKDKLIENWSGAINYLTASMLLIVSEFDIHNYEEGLKIGKVIGNISEAKLRNLMNIFTNDKKMGTLKELFTKNHKKLIKFIEQFCLGKGNEYIEELKNSEGESKEELAQTDHPKSPTKILQNVVLIVLTIVLELSLLTKSDKPIDKLMEGEYDHLKKDAHAITELTLALSEIPREGKEEIDLYSNEFFHEAVEVISANISVSAKKRAKSIIKTKAHIITHPSIAVARSLPSLDKILKAAEINLHKLVVPGFENNDAKIKNVAKQIGPGLSK